MITAAWGQWKRLFVDDRTELRVLQIEAGGYSSPHIHKTKTNVFCIAEGRLVLHVWVRDDERVDWPCGPESQPPAIPAGVMHQFEAMTAAVVYEVSVAVLGETMDPDEIERHGESGVKI